MHAAAMLRHNILCLPPYWNGEYWRYCFMPRFAAAATLLLAYACHVYVIFFRCCRHAITPLLLRRAMIKILRDGEV